jgi:hypothetical protein
VAVSSSRIECYLELPVRGQTKPQSEHGASTEQASRTNVSGLCEVLVKCERTLDIPRTFGMGARLARREDGEKRSGSLSNVMETETELFGGRSGETKTKNFPFHFLSAPPQTPPPKKEL